MTAAFLPLSATAAYLVTVALAIATVVWVAYEHIRRYDK